MSQKKIVCWVCGKDLKKSAFNDQWYHPGYPDHAAEPVEVNA